MKQKIKKIIILKFVLISMTAIAQNVTDGNATEWKLPLKNYDSQAHIQYSASNNDSMLFVCMRVPDFKFQMKIARAGMSLFIDTTGKKKQNIVINYPVKPKDSEPIIMNKIRNYGDNGTVNAKQMIEPSFKQFNSKGFITGNGTYIQKNLEGIITAADLDSIGILTIEYQIPLKTFYHKLTAIDNYGKITFSIVINSLPMPQWVTGSNGGPHSGGHHSGGPPSSANISDPQEMEQMFQSSTTIFKYTLKVK